MHHFDNSDSEDPENGAYIYRFLFKCYAFKGILFIFMNIEKKEKNIDLIDLFSSV